MRRSKRKLTDIKEMLKASRDDKSLEAFSFIISSSISKNFTNFFKKVFKFRKFVLYLQ